MVLSKQAILDAIGGGDIKITPFSPASVGPVSVDLRLGKKFRVFGKKKIRLLADENAFFGEDYRRNTKTRTVGKGGVLLGPGELVLGTTLERITLSQNMSGKLEGRSRFARLGLMVHVSSSLVQPGVDNVQVLEILNVSPFELQLVPGAKICQIVFDRVEGKAKYEGTFRKQRAV